MLVSCVEDWARRPMSSMVITGSRFSNIGGAKNPVSASKLAVGTVCGDFAEVALRVRGIGAACVVDSAEVALRVRGIAYGYLLFSKARPVGTRLSIRRRQVNTEVLQYCILSYRAASALSAALDPSMEALLLLANAATTLDNVAGLRTTKSVAQRAAASLQRGEVFVQPCWLSSVQPARLAAAAQLQQRGWAASTGGEKQVSDWMRNCRMLDMLTEDTWPSLPPVLQQLAAEVDELRAELVQATGRPT